MAARSLREVLMQARGDRVPEELQQLLRHAYSRPHEPGLRQKAERLLPDVELFRDPSPGETLLLATTDGSGSLWALEPKPGRSGDADLSRSCRAQLDLARSLVSRDLPLIAEPEGALDWCVSAIRPQRETQLTGDSFGLSFCLATASAMLRIALPDDLAATAAIASDGTVEPVDGAGLEPKLVALDAWAPNVRRLLVAGNQQSVAESIAARLGLGMTVIGVESLTQAIDIAFPTLVETASRQWHDPALRAEIIDRMFRHVVDGSRSLLRFEGIATACELLEPLVAARSNEAHQLEFARIVARGHDAEEEPLPLHEAWLDTMRGSRQLKVLAHVVSRSLYAEPAERARVLGYAESTLPDAPSGEHAEHLRVLGALGRVFASLGQHDKAYHYLRRAIRGWADEGDWGSASHPLCEVLRVAGIESKHAALRELIAGDVQRALAAHNLDPISRAFIIFAVARAWTQAGDVQEALHWFGHEARERAVDWNATVLHLQASRLRWEAFALDRFGGTEASSARASQLRNELERLAKTRKGTEFAWVLCQLDQALDQGEPGAIPPMLAAFENLEPKALHLAGQQARSSDSLEIARALTRHYPY
jgi:hypothetical protein